MYDDKCHDVCVIHNGILAKNGTMAEVIANPKKELIAANFANRNFRE